MNEQRREVQHLEVQDQVQLTQKLTWEVVSIGPPDEHGMVTVSVKPTACGPSCGNGCDCDSAMLGDCGPFELRISGRKRLAFLGNLGQLLKDAAALQARIARLSGGNAMTTAEATEYGQESKEVQK